jgi:hypothetical protein
MNIQIYNSPYKNILINIQSITPSVSVLYFTDENKNTIQIPDDTMIYIYYIDKPTLLDPYMERYFLSFTDNYELIMNGHTMNLTNKRIWEFQLSF